MLFFIIAYTVKIFKCALKKGFLFKEKHIIEFLLCGKNMRI